MNDSSHISMLFDERKKRGSVEHYWHFLFGYYLPLINYFLKENHKNNINKTTKYLINDCGPLMNNILSESLSAMNIDYTFEDNIKLHRIQNPSLKESLYIKVRRLLKLGYVYSKNGTSIILPRWDIKILEETTFPASFKRTIQYLGQTLPKKFSDYACCEAGTAKGSYLLIKRAPEPSYYKPGGGAEKSGYGAGRRSLVGLEKGVDRLVASGIDCIIYEPGAHNLFCQMNHFSQCSGIIGVRGSEFANVIWMSEGALVLLIHSSYFWNKSKTPPQRTLASLLSVNYLERNFNDEVSPRLDTEILLPIVKRHLQKINSDHE